MTTTRYSTIKDCIVVFHVFKDIIMLLLIGNGGAIGKSPRKFPNYVEKKKNLSIMEVA